MGGKRKGGFGKKLIRPDETMTAVFGSKAMKPTEMTKIFFQYIKRKGLRDGKYVKADANLNPIIGGGKQPVFTGIKKLWQYIKRRGLYK